MQPSGSGLLHGAALAPSDDRDSVGSTPDIYRWLQGPSHTPTLSSRSQYSGVATGTDSSFAMVSGAASSAVELSSAASWSVVGDDEANDAGAGGRRRREFSARSRLPADRLLGNPSHAFDVGELERRLVKLKHQHKLGGELCNELFKRMAGAPVSSHVHLAMRCVERHLRETGATQGLPALAGHFLQVDDQLDASLVHETLLRAHGHLRPDTTLADVAAYLLYGSGGQGPVSGSHIAQLRVRRDALAARWRQQPKGAWTLPSKA